METIAKGMTCGNNGCSLADHRKPDGTAKKNSMISIDMFSDFICPWCLLGATELDELKGKYDFRLNHLGIELFPQVPPEGMKFEDSPMAPHMPGAIAKISKIRDLGIRCPTILPNTKNAILAEAYAVEKGKAHEYAFAMWDAIFRRDINVSSEKEVGKVLEKIGLDPDKVSEYTRDPKRIKELEDRESMCRDTGRDDVPNFIVNSNYSVEGYVSSSKWAEIFDRILGK